MIVSCPNCASKFRTADDGSAIAGSLKCANCGLVFTAQADAVPPPVQLDPAPVVPPQRTVSDPQGKEWDAKMSGASLPQASPSAAPAAAAGPGSLPADFDPLAEVMTDRPAAADLQMGPIARRDPFYEDNPLVVERPAADAADQLPRAPAAVPAAVPAAAPDPFGAAKAATGSPDPFGQAASSASHVQAQAAAAPAPVVTEAAPRNPAELTDPFANVSLLAPSDAPLAGDGDAAGAPPMVESALPPSAPSAAASEASIRPAAVPPSPAPPRPAPARSAGPVESFPPPPRQDVLEEAPEPAGQLLWGLATGLAVLLLAAAGFFALWQFEVLGIDPGFTIAVAKAAGVESPLSPPQGDPRQRSQMAADLGDQAREQGAYGVAAVHYRRALQLEPDADDLRDRLIESLDGLGDASASADLRTP